ncbi:flavin-binding protein [Qipengyuania aurantiaca]|uniref:Flavin-binding protein n=2 Tax=Qipengyuania aurantiaca TaxID=2867233 RepID=A0ABX8ZQD3_9SPHN|nr:flavin-binding protein [Qipengyuania aurantiaca]
MHTPVVATADADARIMVLRDFDAEDWTLRFHTDRRAPKVGVIGDGSPVGVLLYDREEKVQIRCRGRGWIEEDTALADTSWKESDAFARRCYLGAPPGEPRDEPSSGLPDWIEGQRPTEEQLEPARINFAVLIVEIEEADWYYLSNSGHRRALIDRDGGRWITP